MHGESTAYFRFQSLLTLTHNVSLLKWKINMQRSVDEMNAEKKDTDAFSFFFINIATNYIHIEFEQSSFISTEIIDSMLRGEKKLFFFTLFTPVICRFGDFLSMCIMAYLSK